MSRALQRLIHLGCRELGLDTDMRRGLQLVATGKASLSEMTDAEMKQVIDALKSKGFKPGFKAGFKGASAAKHPTAARPDVRYIHVLWRLLGDAGHQKVAGRKGLNALIRANFESKWASVPIDVDALTDAGQINDVIRMLKAMCDRHGIPTERAP